MQLPLTAENRTKKELLYFQNYKKSNSENKQFFSIF